MTELTTPQEEPRVDSSNSREKPPSTCCGGPAPAGADACCARDAEVKSAGGSGCGCGSTPGAGADR
jgi:hypothetical protein